MGIFDFFDMMGTYEERKVARYEKEELCVDTCAVTDSDQPYETGISHPAYNDGEFIIVELYDTEDQARIGHDKWVKKMTQAELPEMLEDVSSSEIGKLYKSLVSEEKHYKDPDWEQGK